MLDLNDIFRPPESRSPREWRQLEEKLKIYAAKPESGLPFSRLWAALNYCRAAAAVSSGSKDPLAHSAVRHLPRAATGTGGLFFDAL